MNERRKQWAVLSREFYDAQAELADRFDALFSEEVLDMAKPANPPAEPGVPSQPLARPATIDAYFDAWQRLQALHERIQAFYFGESGTARAVPAAE
ncbi:MAG: hypothetical protein AB7L76_06740 [Burkholderiaceae bacterium]